MKRMLRKILKKEKKEIEIEIKILTKIEKKEGYFNIVVSFFDGDELLANLISKETFETMEAALDYLSNAKNDDIIEYRAITGKCLIYNY